MLLKDIYNKDFLKNLAQSIKETDKKFNQEDFINSLLNNDWQDQSLKQRMRLITKALYQYLTPKDIIKKSEILKKVIVKIKKDKNSSLALIIFPDFIENYFDQSELELAFNYFEFFTQYASAEFGVRKFINLNEIESFKILNKFSQSKNYHVRRLASEGSRPLLPWATKLENLIKNPNRIITIIENLKFDPELYVRRSVANNLNDISKHHPDLVIEILQKWQKQKVDHYIIKHALRTLLKKGNKKALKIIGIKSDKNQQKHQIKNFLLEKNAIKLNNYLNFSFILENSLQNNQIRLEYAIYFKKKNGNLSKKIFQISSKFYEKDVFTIKKRHLFKDFTTRKHYAGLHKIELIANGNPEQILNFDLKI